MQSLELSARIILPLCILMAVGYLVRRRGICDERASDNLNKLVFHVFLPCNLFCSAYKGGVSSTDPLFVLYTAAAVIISILLLCIIVPRFVKDNSRGGVIVQGIFRSNASIFGVTLASSLCAQTDLGLIAVLLTVIVVLYNTGSVIVLERFNRTSAKKRSMFLSVIKNPSVIGVLAGLAVYLCGIEIPEILYKPVSTLSGLTGPISFLMLGMSFSLKSVLHNRRALIFSVLGRLIIMPGIWITLAVLLGWRGAPIAALISILAAPTAISSYPMARQMGGDHALAGEIVAFTSVFSMLTLFIWIFAASALNWL